MIGTSPGPNQTYDFSKNRLRVISDRGSRSFALVPGNSEKFDTKLTILDRAPGMSPAGELYEATMPITDMLNKDPSNAVYNVQFKLEYESILGNTQEDVFIQNRVRRDSASTLSELLAKLK